MRLLTAVVVLALVAAPSSAQFPVHPKFYLKTDPNGRDQTIVKIERKIGEEVIDDDLKDLAQYPETRSISLRSAKLTAQGIRHLAALKKLETLDLGFTPIKSEGFKELSQLKQLKRLNLINASYTADDLKTLTALGNLESLQIGQNFLCDDAGYQALGEFKKLRWLAVGNSSFGDGGLKAVAALPELRTLTFPGCKVTIDGMQHLAKAPKLERFQGNFGMGAKGLAVLGAIETLRELDLYGAEVHAADIIALPNAKTLTKISPDFRGDGAKADLEKAKAALPNCKFGSLRWYFDE